MQTQRLRAVLDAIDHATAKGDHWAAYQLAVQLENAAGTLCQRAGVQASKDSTAMYRGCAVQAARRGECPDVDALPYLRANDIRSSNGRFLPKAVRERIYQCWLNGSDEEVDFFMSLLAVGMR